MHLLGLLPLLGSLSLPVSNAAETVLGVYIFSRHGDRTAKSTPPANLTDLGYREVFDSGTWFRNKYIASGATNRIAGIETDVVKLSQIAASAPLDNVLMSSAQGFFQGLYPPVGPQLGSATLANGTLVEAPLNGYQLIPIQTVTSGTGSEDSAWLQGAGNCANALVSSNNYFVSSEYKMMLNSTQGFYSRLQPVVNATFSAAKNNFYNAYTIFDLINVAEIHNASIPSSDLLDNGTLFQLRTLADNHEFNLAYNASDPIRAIAGATLAAQIVQALNASVTASGKTGKMNVQFGAYNSFQSFFGLANLTSLPGDNGTNFYGVPDYASTMTFELFTTVAPNPYPAPSDLQVRFYFHNGTTGNTSTPQAFPLFGSSTPEMKWMDFLSGMDKFAIGSQSQWCKACGNTTGVCASSSSTNGSGSSSTASGASSSSSMPSSSKGGNGISTAVGGVIGAMVTLAVILGAEALIMLVAGLKLVRKNRTMTTGSAGGSSGGSPGPKA